MFAGVVTFALSFDVVSFAAKATQEKRARNTDRRIIPVAMELFMFPLSIFNTKLTIQILKLSNG